MNVRKNDLVNMVEHLAESGEVFTDLLNIPQDKLEQLINLLSDPVAIDSLRSLLLNVNNIQRKKIKKYTVPNRKTTKQAPTEDLEIALSELFQNRERFPNVRSIADFSQQIFKVKVPFEKKSRDRYIHDIVRKISRSPKSLANVKYALMDSTIAKKDEAYNLLYKFIRGRLSE